MNNKEYLIQILLKLRSIGIKNEKILKAIEKTPPHFYCSLSNFNDDIKKINTDEVLEIAKLLQLSLNVNYKYENVLLFGFRYGWLLVLLTSFCKRIYGICKDDNHKKKLEFFFLKHSYKNIYLSSEENILAWKKVAPFDLIFIFNNNIFSTDKVTKQLSSKGLAFLPITKKNNYISMISINKENLVLDQTCNLYLLNRSDLI